MLGYKFRCFQFVVFPLGWSLQLGIVFLLRACKRNARTSNAKKEAQALDKMVTSLLTDVDP